MSKKTIYSFEIDKHLLKDCEKLSKELGLDFSTAINIFARKFYRFGGFPFRVEGSKFNKYSFQTMIQSEREEKDSDKAIYGSFSEFLSEKFPEIIDETEIQD